jgi:hypothetical protein
MVLRVARFAAIESYLQVCDDPYAIQDICDKSVIKPTKPQVNASSSVEPASLPLSCTPVA